MFTSYDLQHFGMRLKTMRKSYGYSQQKIAELSGMNIDTLRKIESGHSLPRFDTLEHLSRIYRVNLLLILDQYKTSKILFTYYDRVDRLIASNDPEMVRQVHLEFIQNMEDQDPELIDIKDLNQLSLFFDGLARSYNNDEKSTTEGISLLSEALKVTNPNFKITTFKRFKYNHFERRILFLLSSMLGNHMQCDISNSILLYLLDSFDFSKFAALSEKILIVKSYSVLAYNYHRLNDNKRALKYAELGILYCTENDIMSYLHLLLMRKGIALLRLEDQTHLLYIRQSLQLLKIKNEVKVIDEYLKILENNYQINKADLNLDF